jgi:hypothetical protein
LIKKAFYNTKLLQPENFYFTKKYHLITGSCQNKKINVILCQ